MSCLVPAPAIPDPIGRPDPPQEAKLEGQRRRLKRYQDYLVDSSSATDMAGHEVNDLLNR